MDPAIWSWAVSTSQKDHEGHLQSHYSRILRLHLSLKLIKLRSQQIGDVLDGYLKEPERVEDNVVRHSEGTRLAITGAPRLTQPWEGQGI